MNKKISFFLLALAICLPAANYRWGDSVHSIGLINAKGGEVKHLSPFERGWKRYTLMVTATVIPPYQGDTRVVLEGEPALDYQMYAAAPVIDLGLRRSPKFKDNIFYDLKPKDHIALWVVIKSGTECNAAKGRYNLAFYDTKSNRPVLTVPVTFADKGGENHAGH